MTRSRIALVVCAITIPLVSLSCTQPPLFQPQTWPPLPGIHPGDPPDLVREILGKPNGAINGRWADSIRYDPECQVWFYKGQGRVIFSTFNWRVIETQADPEQLGLPTTSTGVP